jgi:thiol:disulfide interchange protein DsbA
MKSLIKALTFGVLSFVSVAASAVPVAFVEGTHYFPTKQKLPTEGEKIEVVEMFSYTCPHCFNLEASVHEWSKTLPEDVQFSQVQAIFRDSWLELAKVFYAAEATGNMDKLHDKLFNAIHVEKKRLATEEDLLDFVEQQGIDREEFAKAMNSFSVKSKVKRALVMSQASGITGVPSLIINGKYFTSATSAGGVENLYKVAEYLIELERSQKQ